ncbi:MAG: OmpA family protein [Gammaproteobacteria bacterium]|nr:OmpA family protein [Gammaproteobacteria bacterium]
MFSNRNYIKKLNDTLSLRFLLTTSLLLSLSSFACADEVVSFHGKDPSSDDLVNAFMGGAHSQSNILPEGLAPENNTDVNGVKYRGISLKKTKIEPKTAPDKVEQQGMSQQMAANKSADACLAGAQSVAINIRFKSNSSTVKGQDEQIIGKIAQAMNTPQLKNCYFVIEGHTDAIGEEYYNLWLSQKRAGSVKSQLSKHNVNNERLIVVGKGEDELLNSADPGASENRRVQFRVINPVQ